MKKENAFTLTEIAVILVLIALTVMLVVPSLIDDSKKLNAIAQWKDSYQNLEYMFSALKLQANKSDNTVFENTVDDKSKEQALSSILKTFLRFENEVSVNDYKTYYLNGSKVKANDNWYITNLHKTASGKIVGLKWQNTPVKFTDKFPVAIMSVDLNGLKKPNKWGYDIFGVNIYTDRIEPIGKTDDDYLLRSDCSKRGKGLSCSYYYYIYGGQLN